MAKWRFAVWTEEYIAMLKLLEREEVLSALRKEYLDLDLLVEGFESGTRDKNRATLDDFHQTLRKDIAGFDATLVCSLVHMGCCLARAAARSSSQEQMKVTDRGRWWFSFATACGAPEPARLESLELWAFGRSVNLLQKDGPQEVLQTLHDEVGALCLSGPSFESSLKTAIISAAAALLSREISFAELALSTIRSWYGDLLESGQHSETLLAAAQPLGLQDLTIKKESAQPLVSPLPTLLIWKLPQEGTLEVLQIELEDILVELRSLLRRGSEFLSQRTAEQVRTLQPNLRSPDIQIALSFAGQNLWELFTRTGEAFALNLSRQIFLFLVHRAKHVQLTEKQRSTTYHWWMNTQLPELIHTCGLADILKEGLVFYEVAHIIRGDFWLREGLIEAVAGECKRIEAAGQKEEREAFLNEHAAELKQIHSDYVRLSGARQHENEAAAWAYLGLQGESVTSSNPKNKPLETFASDPDLTKVLRGGSHETVLAYVESRIQQIAELLSHRLEIRLSQEHLLRPEDVVYQSGAARRKEPHPSFLAAQSAMRDEQFEKASRTLDSLRLKLSGIQQAICRNHLAYALARQGDLLAARTHLQQLVGGSDPTAYWNLACCIPADQMKERLEVLAKGLEHAPHPQIHSAAVYLALLLDDERVNSWLHWLPRTEALLLTFRLDFPTLSFEQRDVALTRLRSYVEHGEPRCPDPTKRFPYIVPPYQRETFAKFLDLMIEFQQPEVFEFWLRCAELHAHHNPAFWELKVNFLKRTDRMTEAVRAFVEEIPLRLNVLRSLARQRESGPSQGSQGKDTERKRDLLGILARAARGRAAEWLRQAMNPSLKEQGQRIYKAIEEFISEFPDLAPELRPSDRRLLAYYGEPEGALAPNKEATRGTSQEDLPKLLANVGAECVSRLHELSQVPSLRNDLSKLPNALREAGFPAASMGLAELLKSWDHAMKPSEGANATTLQAAAQSAFAAFKTAIDHEIPSHLRVAVAPVLEALGRVDRHLARDMALLPSFVIEPLDGTRIEVDASGPLSFGVRVRIRGQSLTVRLKEASATLDDEQTFFRLRDKLDEIPVTLGSGSTTVLTFESSVSVSLSTPRLLRIQIAFEYGGARYLATPATIELVHRASPKLPEYSPYIFGRPLEVDEIVTHFFGREAEQKAILHSVHDGQQRMRYVEGIRRSGKSSLLHSLEHEISRAKLSLVPVYIQAASVAASDTAGRILFNFLSSVAKHAVLSELGVTQPTEEECCANLRRAYDTFVASVEAKCGKLRVLVLLDDFQVVVETAHAARELQPLLTQGILGFLNMLFEHANPRARILWVLAGQRAYRQFKSLLPGALLWGVLQPLGVDFLKETAVSEILTRPLTGTPVVIPPETTARVYLLTGGHPEVVQQVAEQMLLGACGERRWILTPADAERAAIDVAECSDNFATTWYPVAELTAEQRKLIAALLNAVPKIGGRIESHRLLAANDITEASRQAIDDLVARKILDAAPDGTIGVKAYVLERWLRRFVPTLIDGGTGYGLHGSVAIFIDVANLTGGTGSAWLDNLQTTGGESGVPGRFSLGTVLNCIDQWAASLSPAPIVARWVVNYPLKSPAVVECNAKGYQVENIPQDLFSKGSDDVVLREKVAQIEQWYPTVNHFVLVTGDKDYRLTADRLLKDAKFVHFVSRAGAVASKYEYLAKNYPQRFTLNTIETLLEPTTTAKK